MPCSWIRRPANSESTKMIASRVIPSRRFVSPRGGRRRAGRGGRGGRGSAGLSLVMGAERAEAGGVRAGTRALARAGGGSDGRAGGGRGGRAGSCVTALGGEGAGAGRRRGGGGWAAGGGGGAGGGPTAARSPPAGERGAPGGRPPGRALRPACGR